MIKKISGVLAFLVFAGWAGLASAALSDAIGALNLGDQYRVLFATSFERDAKNDDITSYNGFVSTVADLGSVTNPLGLGWTALASTGAVNAQANTGTDKTSTDSVSIFNTNGDLLATSYSDLWDESLSNPVAYNENAIAEISGVWTGTEANGMTTNEDLEDFGLMGQGPLGDPPSRFTSFGLTTSSGDEWMRANVDLGAGAGLGLSEQSFSIYAISDVATVVPVPAAVWLFGSAVVAFGAVARRRRMAA